MAIATLRKAAVFLKSLPKPHAAALLAKLCPKRRPPFPQRLAAIGRVGREEEEAVLREFAASVLLERIMLHNGHAAEASPFAFLHDLDIQDLLTLIATNIRDNRAGAFALASPAGR